MADIILTDKSRVQYSYENIKTQGWLEGQEVGLDAAVSWIKQQAVTLFRDGKDSAAIQLRKLADDLDQALRTGMIEHAASHERDFPAVVEPRKAPARRRSSNVCGDK